jgi:hypothetical protein
MSHSLPVVIDALSGNEAGTSGEMLDSNAGVEDFKSGETGAKKTPAGEAGVIIRIRR